MLARGPCVAPLHMPALRRGFGQKETGKNPWSSSLWWPLAFYICVPAFRTVVDVLFLHLLLSRSCRMEYPGRLFSFLLLGSIPNTFLCDPENNGC